MNEKEAKKSGPGWIATIGGALLLIVAGFGVGLVAGAASEEPGLVVDLVASKTTEVPLPEQAPPRVREETTDAADTAAPERAREAPAVSSARMNASANGTARVLPRT